MIPLRVLTATESLIVSENPFLIRPLYTIPNSPANDQIVLVNSWFKENTMITITIIRIIFKSLILSLTQSHKSVVTTYIHLASR